MDVGPLANWVTAIVALVLGLRAEMRARAQTPRDDAFTLAQIAKCLSEASQGLPIRPDKDFIAVLLERSSTILDLIASLRNSAEAVAKTNPSAAAEFLDAADLCEDLLQFAKGASSSWEMYKDALTACKKLNHHLRILSIVGSTRPRLKGEVVDLDTIHKNKMYVEFKRRYEAFSDECRRTIFAEPGTYPT